MGQRARAVLWLVWLLGLAGCGATAGHGLVVPVPAAYVAGANPLFPTNSYDAHIRNLLVSGKVAEALGYAKDQYGRVPAWLRGYAAAFDAAKRSVGQCQEVAKAIHGGLSRLGAKPEYVSLRSEWEYMTFKMPDGTEPTISYSGYHVIVRVEQMVYDAYRTSWNEVHRLHGPAPSEAGLQHRINGGAQAMNPGERANAYGVDSLVDELLLMRSEFIKDPQRLCMHIGEVNVYSFEGFLAGYRACQGDNGVKDERYLRFREWLREVKEEFPPEGWRTKYMRDCNNDHTRAIRKFLDFAAEFHAMEQLGTC